MLKFKQIYESTRDNKKPYAKKVGHGKFPYHFAAYVVLRIEKGLGCEWYPTMTERKQTLMYDKDGTPVDEGVTAERSEFITKNLTSNQREIDKILREGIAYNMRNKFMPTSQGGGNYKQPSPQHIMIEKEIGASHWPKVATENGVKKEHKRKRPNMLPCGKRSKSEKSPSSEDEESAKV